MNNKGQALIMFVLLLPVIILLMAVVIDIGNFLVIKNEYTNEVKDTIRHALKNDLDKDKIQALLDNNISGDKEIILENSTLKIKVIKQVDSIFSIIDFNYEINISYIGYIEEDKIIIKKE